MNVPVKSRNKTMIITVNISVFTSNPLMDISWVSGSKAGMFGAELDKKRISRISYVIWVPGQFPFPCSCQVEEGRKNTYTFVIQILF